MFVEIVPDAWRLTSKTVLATERSAVKKARKKIYKTCIGDFDIMQYQLGHSLRNLFFLRSGRGGIGAMCCVEGLGHEFCRNLGAGQCYL